MKRILAIALLALILTGCGYATDPVRLGKQSVSEAQAYDIRTEADQSALDAEQERAVKDANDAIALEQTKIRSATVTAQFQRVLPFVGFAIILAAVGIGLAIAIGSVGASTASAINQNARAIKEAAKTLAEFQKAAQLHPGPTGVFPALVLPKGVDVKVLTPGTNAVLDSRVPRLPATREQARENERLARAALAYAQIMAGNDQHLVIDPPAQLVMTPPAPLMTVTTVESQEA